MCWQRAALWRKAARNWRWSWKPRVMNRSWASQHEEHGMTLALNLDRKAQAASLVHASGVPHRRIEEWKYSDLKAVLGEAGLGAVTAEWLVGNLPAGVEMFDLSQ